MEKASLDGICVWLSFSVCGQPFGRKRPKGSAEILGLSLRLFKQRLDKQAVNQIVADI
jgi:hypothetical protein